ncbi:MAG: substrate-binding domain-containing protein [Lachnospiraceae bacterium]|nr:substrate-binding domain-containing protein [Lachnospiraceae bacterium]
MNRKKNIAIIIEQLDNFFYGPITKGAQMAAQELGINLIVIESGRVFSKEYYSKEKRYRDRMHVDFERNPLISYAATDGIDLVILGSGYFCNGSEVSRKLMARLADKKKLVVADTFPGVPSIQYDNSKGIKDAISYLINEQNCKEILMFSGPEGNTDAEERLTAYREIMEENGLEVDDGMIGYGDFSSGCINEARKLLESNPGADAVVCANDAMAQAIYRVLDEMEMVIGRDIFVTGFDNNSDCTRMEPQLATVYADAVTLGYESVVVGSRMIDGEEFERERVDTQFIPRASCGHEPYRDLLKLEKRKDIGVNSYFDINALSELIVSYVFTGIIHDYQSECQKKLIEDSIQRIVARYFGNVVKRNTSEDIYTEVANVIERGGLDYIEPSRLFRAFDLLYKVYCARDLTMTGRTEMELLLSRIKKKVVELLTNKAENVRKIDWDVNRKVTDFCVALMEMNGSLEKGCFRIIEALERLDVMSAYLYLYDEPVKFKYGDEWRTPEVLYLKAYRNQQDGVVSVPRSKQRIRKDEITGNMYYTGRIPSSHEMISIFFDTWQFGILMLDIPEEYQSVFDIAGYYISNVVNGLIMKSRETNERLIEDVREEANIGYIEEAKEKAGFLRRREFIGMAESMMLKEDVGVMVITILDVGTLVAMNSRYGQTVVCEAISNCQRIFNELYPEESVTGYIGNGVFAAFSILKQIEEVPKKRNQLEKLTRDIFPETEMFMNAYRYHEDLNMNDLLYEPIEKLRDI